MFLCPGKIDQIPVTMFPNRKGLSLTVAVSCMAFREDLAVSCLFRVLLFKTLCPSAQIL